MNKTAGKASETFEAAAFDAGKSADQLRAFAENGMEQSRQAYDKWRSQAEYTQKSLESTLETAKQASSEMTMKSVAAMRANTELGFSHIEALMGAKNLSDMMEIQSGFMRKSMELAMQQAKEFQTTSTKATEEVMKPMKDAFEKSFKELEAA